MYKNIFISQPMTGLSEEDILATRQKEVNEIYQIANKDNVQVNIILALADVLWLCDGWEYSKGCNIELECAIQYGLDIVYPPMKKEGVL